MSLIDSRALEVHDIHLKSSGLEVGKIIRCADETGLCTWGDAPAPSATNVFEWSSFLVNDAGDVNFTTAADNENIFNTIQGAIDGAQTLYAGAGNANLRILILVRPGTYTENITLPHYVMLRGAYSNQVEEKPVVLNGTLTVSDPTANENVRIEGMRISNVDLTAAAKVNVHLSNCDITGNVTVNSSQSGALDNSLYSVERQGALLMFKCNLLSGSQVALNNTADVSFVFAQQCKMRNCTFTASTSTTIPTKTCFLLSCECIETTSFAEGDGYNLFARETIFNDCSILAREALLNDCILENGCTLTNASASDVVCENCAFNACSMDTRNLTVKYSVVVDTNFDCAELLYLQNTWVGSTDIEFDFTCDNCLFDHTAFFVSFAAPNSVGVTFSNVTTSVVLKNCEFNLLSGATSTMVLCASGPPMVIESTEFYNKNTEGAVGTEKCFVHTNAANDLVIKRCVFVNTVEIICQSLEGSSHNYFEGKESVATANASVSITEPTNSFKLDHFAFSRLALIEIQNSNGTAPANNSFTLRNCAFAECAQILLQSQATVNSIILLDNVKFKSCTNVTFQPTTITTTTFDYTLVNASFYDCTQVEFTNDLNMSFSVDNSSLDSASLLFTGQTSTPSSTLSLLLRDTDVNCDTILTLGSTQPTLTLLNTSIRTASLSVPTTPSTFIISMKHSSIDDTAAQAIRADDGGSIDLRLDESAWLSDLTLTPSSSEQIVLRARNCSFANVALNGIAATVQATLLGSEVDSFTITTTCTTADLEFRKCSVGAGNLTITPSKTAGLQVNACATVVNGQITVIDNVNNAQHNGALNLNAITCDSVILKPASTVAINVCNSTIDGTLTCEVSFPNLIYNINNNVMRNLSVANIPNSANAASLTFNALSNTIDTRGVGTAILFDNTSLATNPTTASNIQISNNAVIDTALGAWVSGTALAGTVLEISSYQNQIYGAASHTTITLLTAGFVTQ